MDSKNASTSQQYENPPPEYTQYASSSGSNVVVDASTGLAQNAATEPPSDPAVIKSIYDSVSGIKILEESDTIIVIDDSESVGIYGYWPLVEKMLCHVGPVVATYDPNGITMYCLNSRGPSQDDIAEGIAGRGWNGITKAAEIREIFQSTTPMGTTPIYDKLVDILTPYLARVTQGGTSNRPRPINILVLTDGVADDTEGVEELIGEVCEVLDGVSAPNNQIGLQFVQVADVEVATRFINSTSKPAHEKEALIKRAINDEECSSAWLRNLDDFMKSGASSNVTRDIVDTKSSKEILATGGYNPKNLVKILVGAMSKRHDRMQ